MSLKARVTATATILLFLVLVISVLALTGLEKRSLIREIDSSLDDRITGLIANAAAGQLPRRIPLTGRETGVVQILDQNSNVLAGTPTLGTVPVLNTFVARSSKPEHRTARIAIDESTPEPWRIAGQRVGSETSFVYLYTATNLDSVDRTIGRLRRTLLLGVPLLVAAFGVISWFTTRSSLAPVEQLSATVDAMDNVDVLHHLPEVEGNDELARLVRTTNALLARAAEARRRERRFAADASHELRTPITTARLNLEIGAANPTRENLLESVEQTLVEVGRLEILARDLLEITRLDADRVRKTAADIDLVGLLTTEVKTRMKGRPDLDYRVNAPESAMVFAVDSLVLRAARNLLDNAERHTRSIIELTITSDTKSATVCVHNDGDPIATDDRERIFDPFTRLDEARARDDGGSGLGLAITADIVEAHGGTIAVVDDLRGGATFRFILPTSAS